MLSFIILISITLIFIALTVIGSRLWDFDNERFVLGLFVYIFTAIFLLFTCGLFCSIIGVKEENQAIVYEYQATKNILENYEAGDYGNSAALMDKVIELNQEIASHKAKWNSRWVGVWYSEDVAKLPPLTFKPKRF